MYDGNISESSCDQGQVELFRTIIDKKKLNFSFGLPLFVVLPSPILIAFTQLSFYLKNGVAYS